MKETFRQPRRLNFKPDFNPNRGWGAQSAYNKREGYPIRRYKFPIFLYENNKKVGYLKMIHHLLPKEYFEVGNLMVLKKYRYSGDKNLLGIGGSAIEAVKKYMNDRHSRGKASFVVLTDTIFFNKNPEFVYDFYERHGFKHLPDTFSSRYYSPIEYSDTELRKIRKDIF